MQITDLIERLEHIKEAHGNLVVTLVTHEEIDKYPSVIPITRDGAYDDLLVDHVCDTLPNKFLVIN